MRKNVVFYFLLCYSTNSLTYEIDMDSFPYQKDTALIPVPGTKNHGKIGQTALLKSLSPGESFFIPGASTYGNEFRNIYTLAKKANIKITARTQDGGMRVWRLE